MLKAFVGLLAAGITCVVANAQMTLRVDIANGSTSGNGLGWGANAFKYLQNALAAADEQAPNSVDIWVAQGTYWPDQYAAVGFLGDNDRTKTFAARNNVRVFGGFQGNEISLLERNPELYVTTLSGDLNLDDDQFPPYDYSTFDDNSYHVVSAVGTAQNPINNSAMFNGFVIRGGFANAASPNNAGVGIYCTFADARFIRCVIEFNRCAGVEASQTGHGRGGGIYIDLPSGDAFNGPTFVNYEATVEELQAWYAQLGGEQ